MDALLMTPEEAAEALHIGRAKVYDLMRSGDLRSVRIGGSSRVPCSALREYVEGLVAGDAA